ncbi:MAG: AI-2E family transporter, partial [Pseudomonadota bacterium]
LAVMLPAFLTIIQFASLSVFAAVLLPLIGIQFVVGNVIEPRLMGTQLNLSPLVLMLSLSLWGSIWGIAGMFLCVPIMVILLIILSQFAQTRPLAILMSSTGKVD